MDVSPSHVDSKVRHFLQIADNIRAKQAPFKTYAEHVIFKWILMGIAIFLLAPFVDYFLYGYLAPYGLGWLLLAAMAGIGGLGGLMVVVTLVNGRTGLAYEANLTEIQTLLKFITINRIMPETRSPAKNKSN